MAVAELKRTTYFPEMREKIQVELTKLKPGTTQCPGKLSRQVGSSLGELRPTLEAMEHAGEIKFYQRGRRVRPGKFRGPFRVGRPRKE